MSLTQQVARFACSTPADPGQAAMAMVRAGFVDTVACMLAGRNEPVVRIMQGYIEGRPGGAARLLFGGRHAASGEAALVNGTAAHALDYDDVGLCGHPSAVLVPALLAEGERLHRSGMDVMRAYLVGYETWAELIGRDADQHHRKGWHPTAVFGVLGVAAAVANLRRVDPAVAAHALGIAASLAAGVVANFGSMVKPFHAGRAGAAGIMAVDLAMAGMQASPDVLEHEGGLLAALSPRGRVDTRRPAGLGRISQMARLGLTVKKYPMCFATHRVIDAALDLAGEHDVRAADVASVRATIGTAQAAMLRNHAPRTALEAKFSIEFAVAAAIAARGLGLEQLDDAFVRRADVQALQGLVEISTTDSVNPDEPSLAASDRLVIELRDGRRLDSGEVRAARGTPGSPLAPGELHRKFMDCAASTSWADPEKLYGQLLGLDTLADVASLAP